MKEQYWYSYGRKVTYWQAVRNLIGHLIGTALLFVAFLSLGWGISFAAHWLNSIHPLPVDILEVVNFFELIITWIDAGVCTILVITGAGSFIADGFIGSFVLAAIIITAIPRAIHEVVYADHNEHQKLSSE